MQETAVTLLSPRELAAWRGFLRVHSGIVRELNAELETTHALPLAHYEVLFHLDGAPCGRMTMSALAQSVLLSQSGVTRLVDRLVRVEHPQRAADDVSFGGCARRQHLIALAPVPMLRQLGLDGVRTPNERQAAHRALGRHDGEQIRWANGPVQEIGQWNARVT